MFQFLDHPSEAYIEVNARTDEDVFRDAATALFEIMTDTSALSKKQEFHIDLQAQDRSLLLIDWLNRLILLHELERVFLCEFDVRVEKTEDWNVRATVRGESIQANHERRSQAKSATCGQLEWNEKENEKVVRFVIDI